MPFYKDNRDISVAQKKKEGRKRRGKRRSKMTLFFISFGTTLVIVILIFFTYFVLKDVNKKSEKSKEILDRFTPKECTRSMTELVDFHRKRNT